MAGSRTPVWGPDVIERHTLGLVRLAEANDLATPVPTCEGWDLADLVRHLGEVQHFWAHIIARRPDGPETYDPPTGVADHELTGHLGDVLADLLAALDRADPGARAWSWSEDQTVAFTRRRQSHEALIHHVDGLVAVGLPLPEVPGVLAADGIDELIDVMICGVPQWATFVPAIQVVRVETTDTGDGWTFGLGTLSGTSTPSGLTYTDAPAADRMADSCRPMSRSEAAPSTSCCGCGGEVMLRRSGSSARRHSATRCARLSR